MSKVVAFYDNIYLVATQGEKGSSHRVTERDKEGRPGEVRFSGNYPEVLNPDMTYSTLVLNQDLWKEWFSYRKRLAHMDTAEMAAEYMVSHNANIYYGCPLCTTRFKNYEDAKAHIEEHVSKFISQFRIELEKEEE